LGAHRHAMQRICAYNTKGTFMTWSATHREGFCSKETRKRKRLTEDTTKPTRPSRAQSVPSEEQKKNPFGEGVVDQAFKGDAEQKEKKRTDQMLGKKKLAEPAGWCK